MAKSLEDVLLNVTHVKNKKCDGTLYLLTERLAWMPSGKDTFTISYNYSDIKVQKISPDKKEKIQLQIVLHSSGASTFHFNNPGGRQAQLKDRESVKDLLQQMLVKFKKKINSDLEEKNKMLQEDPELFQLYKNLVVANVLSAEEFWANRLKVLCDVLVYSVVGSWASPLLLKLLNHQGVPKICATMIYTLDKPLLYKSLSWEEQTDRCFYTGDWCFSWVPGCNGIRYNLTVDIIDNIFKTYPAVEQKHAEYVPDKLTEQEFWYEFFQSHYFHRDRMNINDKELFSDCAKNDEQILRNEIEQRKTGKKLDLQSLFDCAADEGYSDLADKESGSIPANVSLIRRFNQHSTMVLKSIDHPPDATTAAAVGGGDVDGEKKVRRDINDVNGSCSNSGNSSRSVNQLDRGKRPPSPSSSELELLSSSFDNADPSGNISAPPKLKLVKTDAYMQGPIPEMVLTYNTSDELFAAAQAFHNDVMSWKCTPAHQILTNNAGLNVLGELAPTGVLMQDSVVQQLNDVVPSDLKQELKSTYMALSELLRHFWACFPVTTRELEEKVIRMDECLKKFQHNKLAPFTEKLQTNYSATDLTSHMHTMLEKAYTKFSTWQSKKLSKRS